LIRTLIAQYLEENKAKKDIHEFDEL
jgi:hypothetical protein